MKKIITILAIIFGLNTYAQTDTTTKEKIKIFGGITLAPQGVMDLKNPQKAITNRYTNIFPAITIAKGKVFSTTFYSFNFNSIGTAIGYNWTDKYLNYVVATKSILVDANYIGLGFGTPLANGRATGFVECGSSIKKWTPALYRPIHTLPGSIKIIK